MVKITVYFFTIFDKKAAKKGTGNAWQSRLHPLCLGPLLRYTGKGPVRSLMPRASA